LGIDVASDAGMNFLLGKGAIVERTSLMTALRPLMDMSRLHDPGSPGDAVT